MLHSQHTSVWVLHCPPSLDHWRIDGRHRMYSVSTLSHYRGYSNCRWSSRDPLAGLGGRSVSLSYHRLRPPSPEKVLSVLLLQFCHKLQFHCVPTTLRCLHGLQRRFCIAHSWRHTSHLFRRGRHRRAQPGHGNENFLRQPPGPHQVRLIVQALIIKVHGSRRAQRLDSALVLPPRCCCSSKSCS